MFPPLESSMALFEPLPQYPDHPALESDVLAWWEQERTSSGCASGTGAGRTSSFIDGPITANNPMGVHHAWGRTLKDVFQRYKALRGFDLRYQNGFDCQGLWVEVEVEKALGLNSKREIEEYGLAEFAARCRERVAEFAEVITRAVDPARAVDGLGQRLLHLQRHEHRVHLALPQRGAPARLAVPGPPLDAVVPALRHVALAARAGWRADDYERVEHPSLFVRFPLKGREGESLVVWTTTPWTLPANVAAAVKPDAEYGSAERRVGARSSASPTASSSSACRGAELVGLEYEGPFDELQPAQGVVHRVIPWDEVSLDEGTGIVHIAPGAGSEDFELSKRARPAGADADRRERPLLPGLRLAARARRPSRSRSRSSATCASAGLLVEAGTIRPPLPASAGAAGRRSSSASSTTGSSRVDEIREPTARGERRRRVDAAATTASAWTTGSATWATGTSRASATSGCRCPSIRARAGT